MKRSVLTRYRTMAYVTAVTLLVFSVCIVVTRVLRVGADLRMVVSQIHGLFFLLYVIFAFDLGQKAGWSFRKLVWVLVAGCIPFCGFFVERGITRETAKLIPDRKGGAVAPEPHTAN